MFTLTYENLQIAYRFSEGCKDKELEIRVPKSWGVELRKSQKKLELVSKSKICGRQKNSSPRDSPFVSNKKPNHQISSLAAWLPPPKELLLSLPLFLRGYYYNLIGSAIDSDHFLSYKALLCQYKSLIQKSLLYLN